MTISYTREVATAKLGTFGRLLFRWKASVYKLIWKELVIYIMLYALIAVIYRFGLHALGCGHVQAFEAWAVYCKENASLIPLTFVLGFFVNLVISRWWSILGCVCFPDRACFCVNELIIGNEPLMIQYRRAIARYLNLAQLLVLRDVSTSVKTRFPTLDKVVTDGFMTPEEKDIYDNLKGENQLEKHHKYWLPIHWASDILCRIHDQKKSRDAQSFKLAFTEILALRDKMGLMLAYDWVSIPLSYTQVVTLVVYSYFLTNVIGKQYLYEERRICPITNATSENDFINASDDESDSSSSDHVHPIELIQKYLPVFPILEFLFYMGWLKVAESIMNPLGQDDDDFEINYLINRNLAVSYAIVDSHRSTCPQVKDETAPSLPESKVKARQYLGSATDYTPSVKDDSGDVKKDGSEIAKAEEGIAGPSGAGSDPTKVVSGEGGRQKRASGEKKQKKTYGRVKLLKPVSTSGRPKQTYSELGVSETTKQPAVVPPKAAAPETPKQSVEVPRQTSSSKKASADGSNKS